MRFAPILTFFIVSVGSAACQIGPCTPTPCPDLRVESASAPRYPPIAAAAHVSGTVRLTVTVKNGKVTRIERSAGPINLFTEAAQENVSSWAFASQIRAKFDVEYIYEIAGPEVDFPVNPHIEMDLPFRVKLTSNPVKARTEY